MQSLKQKSSNSLLRSRQVAAPAVMFLLVVLVYLPSVGFDFIYDDHKLILEQAAPESVRDVVRVFGERHWYNLPYYRPVVRSTMVIQKLLHGDDPAPYHAFNVVLMGIAALVTWSLLRRPVFGIRPFVAVIGAALFALHPIASSTVYPVCSGRETLLPTVLIIAAMSAYLRPGKRWRLAAVSLFAVSLLCKEQAAIVPLLFVLADVVGLTGDAPRRAAIQFQRYAPIAVILAAYGVIRWSLFHGTQEHRLAILDDPAGPLFSVMYAVQTVWMPFAELVYEPPIVVWMSVWRLALGATVTLLVAVCALRSRPSARSTTLFWLGWILLSLLPTANILQQEAPFAERYLLLALAGLTGLLGTLASTVWDRPVLRKVMMGASIVLLFSCAATSFHRGPFYENDLSFHSQWVRMNPQSDQAHRSLGWVLLELGRLEDARRHLERAIQINPDNAEAYNNLGNVFAQNNQLTAAIETYERALRIDSDSAKAHYNLAVALARTGDLDRAVRHFEQAIRRPDYSEAHNGLGIALQMRGQSTAAAAQFEQALRINPNNAEAHNNLGNLLAAQGHYTRAAEHFEHALRISPTYLNARENLARVRNQLEGRE